MNGSTAKLLRKVAKTIGRDPKYIKKHYLSMNPSQQLLYKTYVKESLNKLTTRKEELDGKNLPALSRTNSPTGERE